MLMGEDLHPSDRVLLICVQVCGVTKYLTPSRA